MPIKKQVEKPLDKLSRKLIRFAEIYASGAGTMTAAAIEAGYSPKVANAHAWEWIGKSRENSKYPFLYDYYEKLRKESLRILDVEKQNVLREIALVAFSDVTRFVDLPRKEYEDRKVRALAIQSAVWAVQNYQAWEKEKAEIENGTKKKPKREPEEPTRPTWKQINTVNEFIALPDEERASIMVWKDYYAGSIRLKNAEEIPKELLPAIAELSNTRDGIKVKLHDKMSALDKLARHLKLYESEEDDKPKVSSITTVTFTVNGTRSSLLDQELAPMKISPAEDLGATG